jgi:hypothetical protein
MSDEPMEDEKSHFFNFATEELTVHNIRDNIDG